MLKVVFDMVGLQAVHIWALFGGTVVQVVVDHIVDHVATQPSNENADADDVRQHVVQYNVETAHRYRCQARWEDQPWTIEGRLWESKMTSHTSVHVCWEQLPKLNVDRVVVVSWWDPPRHVLLSWRSKDFIVTHVYLVVLSVQEEVKRDEIVVMGRWFHVKDKTMDAVLDEGPHEPAHQKQRQEKVLMDWDGDV